MLFSSPLFLFFFLPAVLAGFFLIRAALPSSWWLRAANAFLLAASLLFYGWGEPAYFLLMCLSITVDYLCGRALARPASAAARRGILAASVSVHLLLLGYFKYARFAATSIHKAAAALGIPLLADAPFWEIALPLGISFYTFQSMSYVIDVYRGDVTPVRRLTDYLLYVTFFPQLVAGPIVRYRDIAGQIDERRVSSDRFASGARRFVWGLGKKVLVADVLAAPVEGAFDIPREQLTTGLAWLGLAGFTLQLYFDFSGYSDMAIGMGRMFGFDIPENFRYPYAARSMRDLWTRWHVSLATWFRDYLYIPLGGNHGSPMRATAVLWTVFLASGLWHGANWTFVAWGLWHGVLVSLERAFRLPDAGGPVRHVYVVGGFMAGLVLFRCHTLTHAVVYAKALLGAAAGDGSLAHAGLHATPLVLWAVAVGVFLCVPDTVRVNAFRRVGERLIPGAFLPYAAAAARLVGILSVLLASFAAIAGSTHRSFIYFRF